MFEAANTLIEAKMRSDWTGTLVDYDNVEFTPVRGIPFVRLQVIWTDANTVSVSGRDRGEGYIQVSIFVASNTGTYNISLMTDQLAAIYSKWDTGHLKCKISRPIRIGDREQWYRVDLVTPFTYDECN